MGQDYKTKDITVDNLEGVPAKKKEQVKQTLIEIEPNTILVETRRKERLEEKAYEGLEKLLEARHEACPKCNGSGLTSKGDDCYTCSGEGTLCKPPSERMIELVLAPKFPKTAINLNAEVEGLGRDDLLRVIGAM